MFQTLFKYGPAAVSTCSCPRCGSPVSATEINVGADTALCRHCGSAFRFSSLVDGGAFVTYDLSNPPEEPHSNRPPMGSERLVPLAPMKRGF